MHVNEFKTALTKEALVTTQDVGRLREERKNLEHELADMFALKAKYSPGADLVSEAKPISLTLLKVHDHQAVYPVQNITPTPPIRDHFVGRRPLPVPTPKPYVPWA